MEKSKLRETGLTFARLEGVTEKVRGFHGSAAERSQGLNSSRKSPQTVHLGRSSALEFHSQRCCD
jgi:hypothetical protein